MKKKISYVWILLFLMMLIVPNVYEVVWGKEDTKNQEYRERAEKPQLSLEALESFADDYEAYYNDNLPGREAIISANSILDVELLGGTVSDRVVMGYDEWLYLKESVEWYKGTALYTEAQLIEIKNRLMKIDAVMKEKGGEFVLFIAPNKETIYPENLPEAIQRGETNKTEQLIEYLSDTDIQIVFPKDILSEHKDWKQLYAKWDTHWNNLGGYMAAYSLVQELDASIPAIEELDIYEKEFEGQDLARQLNLEGYFGTEADYDFVGYAPYAVNVTRWDNVRNWYDLPSSDMRKLFFVRDSFGTAMQYFVATPFAETCVTHHNDYTYNMFLEENPDIFVLEFVERNLDELLNEKFDFYIIE